MLSAVSQSQGVVTSTAPAGHTVISRSQKGSVITTVGRNIITIARQPTTSITSAGKEYTTIEL